MLLQRIMVTLLSEKPCSFSNEPLGCVVTKILYGKPIDEICDWDDRVKVIRWVDGDSVAGRCVTDTFHSVLFFFCAEYVSFVQHYSVICCHTVKHCTWCIQSLTNSCFIFYLSLMLL